MDGALGSDAAGLPLYGLHNLGWNSFQYLCIAITREILGQTVESYLESADGGRGEASPGTWRPMSQEDLTGKLVIQCKFISKRVYGVRASDLSDEFKKAKKLVARGLCLRSLERVGQDWGRPQLTPCPMFPAQAVNRS
jgi:hypothetical protein